MSILDVIIILIILMFGAVGYKKGVIKEGVEGELLRGFAGIVTRAVGHHIILIFRVDIQSV